jgi:hypothetical protein
MKNHSILFFQVTYQTNNGVRSTVSIFSQLYSSSRQIFEGTTAQGFCLYTDYETLKGVRREYIAFRGGKRGITTKMILCWVATAGRQTFWRLDALST